MTDPALTPKMIEAVLATLNFKGTRMLWPTLGIGDVYLCLEADDLIKAIKLIPRLR